MCTLLLWHRLLPGAEVVVAANRDEAPARPFADPASWPEQPGLLAGRDLAAGGTWLGVNQWGVVCGITNQWGLGNDPTLPSRGSIVRDVLRAGSARKGAAVIAAIGPGRFNPCALLIADRAAAFRADYGTDVAVRELEPGIAVLANWAADRPMPRSDRGLALAGEVPRASFDAALPALERLLADHDGAELPGGPICVHGDRYATVCSTVIAVGERTRWRDLRGNPCHGTWVERAAP